VPDGKTLYMTPKLQRWRDRTDGPLLVLAIGTLPFLLLDFKLSDLPRQDRLLINAVNVVVLIAFAVAGSDDLSRCRVARLLDWGRGAVS
jgi:hypothetical protein